VDIGGADSPPEAQLFQVRSAVRLSDGRIVVVNAGSRELRFYGPDGTYLMAVGREGDGPGEFREPYDLFRLRGDTLLVYDLKQGRVSVFGPLGQFVRSYRLPFPVLRQLVGAFPDGRLVAAHNYTYEVGPDARFRRTPLVYVVYDRTGELTDTLARSVPPVSYRQRHRNVEVALPLPFGRSPVAAVGRHRFYVGYSDVYEIKVYDDIGTLIKVVRRRREPILVTREHIEAYRRATVGVGDGDSPVWDRIREARRHVMQDMLESVDLPETMPAFADLRVDEDNYIWVEEYAPPGEPRSVWSVFSPGGSFLGQVEMPAQIEVQQIGGGFVVGLYWGELGLEHVAVYRLDRGIL
jgi:hypothetical protein